MHSDSPPPGRAHTALSQSTGTPESRVRAALMTLVRTLARQAAAEARLSKNCHCECYPNSTSTRTTDGGSR